MNIKEIIQQAIELISDEEISSDPIIRANMNTEFITACQKHFPKLQIKYKDQSRLMKFLGTLLFFNPKFMTDYVTTIGNTIYFPTKRNEFNDYFVVLHELVHIWDSRTWIRRLGFSLGYLFPQILTLLAIPMFFLSWKLALPCFLFLLPLPAYFRMKSELKAYATQLYCYIRYFRKAEIPFNAKESAELFQQEFRSSSYYFMWPFAISVDEIFLKVSFLLCRFHPRSCLYPYDKPGLELLNILDKLLEEIQP